VDTGESALRHHGCEWISYLAVIDEWRFGWTFDPKEHQPVGVTPKRDLDAGIG
jgi:hypothetical protein